MSGYVRPRPRQRCRLCREFATVRLIVKDERGKPMTVQSLCAEHGDHKVALSPLPDRLTLVPIPEVPAC